jgi:ABC-2 type transport system ATP-binding protein
MRTFRTAAAVAAACAWRIRPPPAVRTVDVVIEVSSLTKRYGLTVAVRNLSFTVHPGHVTGFLGPNGSGKSTTMRVILGLDAPTVGEARVGGCRYADLRAPLREVGAMLDARAVHPGRTAHDHLLALARSNGIPRSRVGEVLGAVGLSDVAGHRAGGFSLGMSQRLGIAAALLGDPGVLLFDEPVNGLDTEGIRWIRSLMKGLAAEGRTVFVSSHLMSEMELTADRLVVIGRGRLIAEATVSEFIDAYSMQATVVRSPEAARLRRVLEHAGGSVDLEPSGAWRVSGLDAATVGDLALANGVVVHELRPLRSSLEDVYSQLTDSSVEYRAEGDGEAHRQEALR